MSLSQLLSPPTPSPSKAGITTLAHVRAMVRADTTLTESRRGEIASAITTICRALGQPAETVSASPANLRAALKHLTPAMARVSPGRWRNARSLLAFALARAGLVTIEGRARATPSAAWSLLLSGVSGRHGPYYHLGRFARWCTAQSIEPHDVSDAVLGRYQHALADQSLTDDPARSAKEVARAWNTASAAQPSWPQIALSVPDNRRAFTPDWDAYPPSLKQDVDALLGWLGDDDPFGERPSRALRPASLATRRKQIRSLAGALVVQGVPPSTLTDLRATITLERCKLALRYFWDKAGAKPTTHTAQLAGLCLMIARHWVHLPPHEITHLKDVAERLTPKAAGISDRNTERLLALEDAGRLRALLTLPERLMDLADNAGPPSLSSARLAQAAVAIAIELRKPLRLRNLQELRIGTTLIREHKDLVLLLQPADDVKNRLRITAKIEGTPAKLIATYIDRYRPLLATAGGDWLFPGKTAQKPKSSCSLRDQITDAIAKHAGLAWHPHLFRHCAAWLILREDPKAHGAVQRILGNKTLYSVMNNYSGLESISAGQRLSELIDRRANADDPQARRPSRGTRT
ncbi:MAG: tyrosine-type recombinase/integrase [Thermohalobaculum sp.]